MFILDGKKLRKGEAFSIGEGDDLLQFPPNWLELSTAEDREPLGIFEAPDPIPPDPRFFDATEAEDGSLIVTKKPKDQIIQAFESALDAHLDAAARAFRYDNRFTFAMRAGYVGPYQTEATTFAQWMDACNEQAYSILADVEAGKAEEPESIEAFIALLPVL